MDDSKYSPPSLASSTTLVKEDPPQRKFRLTLLLYINHTLLLILLAAILIDSILNIIEQLAPSLYHLPSQQTQIGCNGHPSLCHRSYSNITQIATHGSPFVGILPMDNQNLHVPAQLDAGIRFLQAQTHLDRQGALTLCHTECGMKDAGSVADYLSTIVTWLVVHPHEVVTLLLTNGDHVSVDYFAAAFSASGAAEITYVPFRNHTATNLNTWPTLAELISAEKRLVAFVDANANTSVPYILDEWAYFWETPFDVTDPSFSSCAIDRPEGLRSGKNAAVAKQRMYIANHFLDTSVLGMVVPDRRDAGRTNAEGEGVGGLAAQVGRCRGAHGRAPKGVLVDYFEKGNAFVVQDGINGV